LIAAVFSFFPTTVGKMAAAIFSTVVGKMAVGDNYFAGRTALKPET
jgi:hypothetical protein